MRKVRVVCVDDSLTMRRFLSETLSLDPEIEVAGTAEDCFEAREKIMRLKPDVITLDINMPCMTGLEFLSYLMRVNPLPVIMFSGTAPEGSDAALVALSMGAIDVVEKPAASQSSEWFNIAEDLCLKIKSSATARMQILSSNEMSIDKKNSAIGKREWPKDRVVGIGASTGGVQAIREILAELPVVAPPILIAQHMPATFTKSFARRLNLNSAINVCQAVDGQPLRMGEAYIGPGDRHLTLAKTSAGLVCRLVRAKSQDRHVPSVDVLFESLAKIAGPAAMGVLLTGMGRDGARGMEAIQRQKGLTAAQDKATSLIYGMPKSAVEKGAVDKQLPLSSIAKFITSPKPRRSTKRQAELLSTS